MQTIPVITIESAERLLHALEDFLEKSEASFAVVIDRGGTILAQHGSLPLKTDVDVLAALAAGSFAATQELALRIGEADFSAVYQQGSSSHILLTAVDEGFVLMTCFGQRTTVGLVRFYSARATKRIAAILQDARSGVPIRPVFSEADVNDALSGNRSQT